MDVGRSDRGSEYAAPILHLSGEGCYGAAIQLSSSNSAILEWKQLSMCAIFVIKELYEHET
jgi:hypothetical protein